MESNHEEEVIQIDETRHLDVPTRKERVLHSLFSIFLGFLLVQIIGFWLFPGVGLGGLYMFSSAHSLVSFIGDITNIVIVAFLAICGVFGWFQGQYFTDRLKGCITWWKFW
ncbi:hypothetical protein NC796_05075 [Aliifodinibius sp. S!AR15-10]|uniref:hypothetical protein n=1 Tax=Aliifodinibius sp. S!AR15-10 TaxID=2950437 RepID=UPI002856CCA0|nr:hypothetical protein [Aliifodinibius sp. S!AR15-10]MDR8390504.1 hypothetical protein [Aliifodinibius sp. S!AR15-10]